MRCRTLARELRRCGAEVIFLCRRQHGDLINLLESEFPVLPLPEQPWHCAMDSRTRSLSFPACCGGAGCLSALSYYNRLGSTGSWWITTAGYPLGRATARGFVRDHACPKLLRSMICDRTHRPSLLIRTFEQRISAAGFARQRKLRPVRLTGPSMQMHPLLVDQPKSSVGVFLSVDPDNLCR